MLDVAGRRSAFCLEGAPLIRLELQPSPLLLGQTWGCSPSLPFLPQQGAWVQMSHLGEGRGEGRIGVWAQAQEDPEAEAWEGLSSPAPTLSLVLVQPRGLVIPLPSLSLFQSAG